VYKKYGKRAIDLIISLTGLILVSPILLMCSLAVLIKNGSPVIFSQLRPGLKNQLFELYKFRSMTHLKDESGRYLSDSERITPVGSLLRKTSFDELPSLYNVLKGDMSLVGPRPLLVEYLPLYSKDQARRHEVKPGITGWAQVNGRNTISWEEKFLMDVWYVENQSIILDLKIILKTINKVVMREGISSGTSATMEKFIGK
jgi:sugar transferase EpsL